MKTSRIAFVLLVIIITLPRLNAQSLPTTFPVKGFEIAAPMPKDVDRFVKFIHEELASRKVNTLILRVDYNYQYNSHPELRDSIALSKSDVDKIADICRRDKIRVIPQVNLLGHQSWASKPTNLIKKYPQFDETPWVKFPPKYEWPNADGLYCKSYCPLHPDVHGIVFDLIDELCDAFQADGFHAGMDEVFYIGEDKCPRCGGRDKAELFAFEVRTIAEHLKSKKRELWIWGDRLLDGKTMGLGMWEASMNNTYRAIDMIPKDVVICDWHYERPDLTAVVFASKGLRVVTCPFNKPLIGEQQVVDMASFRSHATPEMKDRFYGIMQTVWSGTDSFLDGFYGVPRKNARPVTPGNENNNPWATFKGVYGKIADVEK